MTTRRSGSMPTNFRPSAPRNFQRDKVIPSTPDIRKLVGSANRFGNRGIKEGQLTTFEIYHYLPFTQEKTTLNFFENVKNVAFPLTNLNDNMLQVGEAMIIDRLHFTIATIDFTAPANPIVKTVQTIEQAGFSGAYLSALTWFNDNNRVIKNLSLTQMQSEFNRMGWNADNNSLHLDTKISIQPLLRFICQLQMPDTNAGEPVVDLFIGCHACGVGTLLSPKTPY